MSRLTPDDIDQLRQDFAAGSTADEQGVGELDPARIWRAVRGELPPREVEALADLASRSPNVAAEWRLAVELSRELDATRDAEVVSMARPGRRRWAIGLAAAAVVVIGLALPLIRLLAPAPTLNLRAADPFEISTELVTDQALPRDDFELHWSSVGEGWLYDIVVTDADLSVLDRASFLEESRYTVPASALDDLPSGAEVLWKVDAIRPDGGRVSSATFVQRVR